MEYINNYDSDSDSDSVNNIDIINYNVSIAEILDEKDKELITIKEKLYNTQINLKDTTRVLEETLLANSKDQNMKTNNIINIREKHYDKINKIKKEYEDKINKLKNENITLINKNSIIDAFNTRLKNEKIQGLKIYNKLKKTNITLVEKYNELVTDYNNLIDNRYEKKIFSFPEKRENVTLEIFEK